MLGVGLNDFSMWLDEVNIVRAALAWNPLDFATYGSGGHPPLYFILLKSWIALAGQDDLALRALTFSTGLLTAAVVYRLAADVSRRASGGALAALMFGAMGFARYYVHETHNYAQLMLFAALALMFAMRWWRRPQRRAYAFGVALSIAGLIYTHYYSIYFLAALNIGALIFAWRRWGQWARWLGVEALAGLLYAPWLYRIVLIVQRILEKRANQQTRIYTAQPTTSQTLAEAITTLLSDQAVLYAMGLALGIGGLVWLWRARRAEAQRLLPQLAMWAVIVAGCFAFAFIVNQFYETFSPRRIIYVLPVFAALLGATLALLPRKAGWAAGLIITATTAWHGWSSILPGNWQFRQAIEAVRDQLKPGDLVLLQATDAPVTDDHSRPFIYYGRTLLPPQTLVMTLGEKSILGASDSDNYFADHVFAPAVVTHRRFWVVSAIDPNVAPATLEWVGKLDLWPYQPVNTQEFGPLRVTLFERLNIARAPMPDAAAVTPPVPVAQVFGDLFELDQVQISKTRVKPGDQIVLWLDWQALRRPDQDYAIFVHLLADPPAIAAQADGDPLHMGIAAPTSLWAVLTPVYDTKVVTLPPDLSPGTYQLRLGIYSRITGQRLPVIMADGTLSDNLLLAEILAR